MDHVSSLEEIIGLLDRRGPAAAWMRSARTGGEGEAVEERA